MPTYTFKYAGILRIEMMTAEEWVSFTSTLAKFLIVSVKMFYPSYDTLFWIGVLDKYRQCLGVTRLLNLAAHDHLAYHNNFFFN